MDTPEFAPLNTLYVATRRSPGPSDPVVASVRTAIVEIGRATES